MDELTCSSFHFPTAVGASQALTFTSSEGQKYNFFRKCKVLFESFEFAMMSGPGNKCIS